MRACLIRRADSTTHWNVNRPFRQIALPLWKSCFQKLARTESQRELPKPCFQSLPRYIPILNASYASTAKRQKRWRRDYAVRCSCCPADPLSRLAVFTTNSADPIHSMGDWSIFMKQRRNPHRIDAHYTKIAREMYEVFPLLSPGTPANVTVFAVDQRRGRAYYSKRVVTLPLWVFKNPRGEGFALYYLAHELAHIADFDAGNRHGNHGPTFM